MSYLGPIISLVFVVIAGRLLLKKYNPHAVLLVSGLLMLIVAQLLNYNLPALKDPTGFSGFDLFKYIKESFSKTNAGVGLMIMAIGGFVAYIDHVGASNALVSVAMKPLKFFKKKPYIAASLVIPIGQLLFAAIPSAAGLGLLLMASLFPILVNLGVSRLSAVSVITATTAFGVGPASAITASATSIAGIDTIVFFLNYQIPLIWPLSIVMMITYYIVNRYYDKKNGFEKEVHKTEEKELKAPLIYAIIPILPIVLLIVFSEIFSLFSVPISIDTTTAMFISLFIALICEFIRTKNIKQVFDSLKIFWNGMGNIFKTVVTLIITADIFAKGLISLGFIDGLLDLAQNLGFGAIGIGVVMTIMIFLASMLMGSGNASFFAFGPLVPKIAKTLGVESTSIILPMQLSASMGRTVSPIAGVIIATAEIAKVSTISIVKRNIIPLVVALLVMLLYHFI
ncbi:C4-dicarboxylate transporter DcuC [Winogradskyella sp. UBA3174]|uniref:C4-dicarboxylate transporter DcuC n=1 Tax=Winogradskyella sp. UBA3174 TaxID=1947785 RepID=UPI0025F01AAE|nr:C4-dicarboxylate transporter DcuC [Winogradskyella sp. UBA3174]|tara:strand:+ start:16354 stop:17715 length:1362 start_codon:yes stop_codon:yes gene_type:complete